MTRDEMKGRCEKYLHGYRFRGIAWDSKLLPPGTDVFKIKIAQAYLDLDARARSLLIAANNVIEFSDIGSMNALIEATEAFHAGETK